MSLRRRLMSNSTDVLYLYNEGDECVDVTGGWRSDYPRYIFKYENYIEMAGATLITNNRIVSDFNKINMLAEIFPGANREFQIRYGEPISSSNPMPKQYFPFFDMSSFVGQKEVFKKEMPNFDGYFGVRVVYGSSELTPYIRIYKLWLSK